MGVVALAGIVVRNGILLVEFTDVIFALDSIPAVFSVSLDPYVVFFSNIFAIIGLRSLFFLLANMIDKFRFLNVGVSILLVFVGVKLLAHSWLADIGFKPDFFKPCMRQQLNADEYQQNTYTHVQEPEFIDHIGQKKE